MLRGMFFHFNFPSQDEIYCSLNRKITNRYLAHGFEDFYRINRPVILSLLTSRKSVKSFWFGFKSLSKGLSWHAVCTASRPDTLCLFAPRTLNESKQSRKAWWQSASSYIPAGFVIGRWRGVIYISFVFSARRKRKTSKKLIASPVFSFLLHIRKHKGLGLCNK